MISRSQIVFKGVDASPALEDDITQKIARLERAMPSLQSCRVVVEAPHRHHAHGRLYRVLVDVTLPGCDIVVDTHGAGDQAHEDVYVAVRDAFAAVRRRLRDAVQHRRDDARRPSA